MFISNVSGFWFVFPELTWMKTFKSYITHIILFLASTVTLFWNSWPPGQVDLTELILISADPTWLNKDKHYKRNKASVTPTVSTWRNVPAELHRDGLKTDNKMNLECFYFETIKTKRKWSFKIKGPSVLVEASGESLWSMMLLLIRFDLFWSDMDRNPVQLEWILFLLNESIFAESQSCGRGYRRWPHLERVCCHSCSTSHKTAEHPGRLMVRVPLWSSLRTHEPGADWLPWRCCLQRENNGLSVFLCQRC